MMTLLIVVVIAAAYDLRYRRIPNWLSLLGLILGFGLHWQAPLTAAEGMLLALAVYLPLYLLRGMGAGDVKLMAAVGALAGPSHWFLIFLCTALAGGCAGTLLALIRGRFTETCCHLYFLLRDLACLRAPHRTNPQLDFRHPGSLRMPHGALIALGTAAQVFLSLHFRSGTDILRVLHTLS